jgi:hypothetical protein
MNYSYLYIDKYSGQDSDDFFAQLKKSVSVLKEKQPLRDNIYVFNDQVEGTIKDFCQQEGCIHQPITLSKNYPGSGGSAPINILVEKIISLRDFDENKDIVLLDVDTLFLSPIPEVVWRDGIAAMWNYEYPLTQFRNLDRVLPHLPWSEIGIPFNNSYPMYNTGVVYIPKKHRKEICEKALWIVDKLNDGTYLPEDRAGSKLDEQIGLSIAVHDVYGKYGNVKLCYNVIHHYWKEKQDNIRWWEQ